MSNYHKYGLYAPFYAHPSVNTLYTHLLYAPSIYTLYTYLSHIPLAIYIVGIIYTAVIECEDTFQIITSLLSN